MAKQNSGFVSLVALLWFSFVLAFLASALTIMNNFSQAWGNLKTVEKELSIERVVAAKTLQLFSELSEENYCDFIGDYEVCWLFFNDFTEVTIDYHDYEKRLLFIYDWNCDCFIAMDSKVDK